MALCALAQHCRLLRLPAQRLVVNRQQELSGAYYLVAGSLRLLLPEGISWLHAGTAAATAQVPAGRAARCRVETASACELLWVDTAQVNALLLPTSPHEAPPLYAASELDDWSGDDWLRVLLGGALGRQLASTELQQLCRLPVRQSVLPGQQLIAQGTPGTEFFLLEAGVAEVSRQGRVLAQLQPGDFFGEEALLSGRPRNADVHMRSAGTVLVLAGADFLALVTAGLRQRRQRLPQQTPRVQLDLDTAPWREGDLRLLCQRLDPDCCYGLLGGTKARRLHAVFLLTHLGYQVQLLPLQLTPPAQAAHQPRV